MARSAGAACPACGGASVSWVRARDWNRRISDHVFEYDRCHACGLLFLRDVPDDLASYYGDEYYQLPATRGELGRRAIGEVYKLELVRALCPRGRLVEIGPGEGGFAHLAQDAGYDVTAIEMNPRVVRFLRDVVGIDAIQSDDEIATLRETAPADGIVLWHVLEHLVEPWTLVATAAERLKPGGVLVIAAPNPDSLQCKLLGARWVHLDAPRHVRLMPAAMIERWGAAAGLVPCLRTTRDAGSQGWNEFGWRFLPANLTPTLARRTQLRSKAAQLAGMAFARAIRGVEDREGAGTAYTVALRKPA